MIVVLQTEQTERLRKTLHIDITDGMILAVTNQGKRLENFKNYSQTKGIYHDKLVFLS